VHITQEDHRHLAKELQLEITVTRSLTGSCGTLVHAVLVWVWVCSWKAGGEDVSIQSAPLTGGSTACIFIHKKGGVDVFLVCSVFPFLAVAGAITVDNSWGERSTFRTSQ
jgi:hypothetical protein